MGERVFSVTEDRRILIDNLKQEHTVSQVPTDIKKTVWVSPNKASIVVSSLVVGRPRGEDHKDKRYYKWRTTASLGLYRNRGGNPQPYHATRPWNFNKGTPWAHRNAHTVFGWMEEDSDLGRAFKHACWQTFDVTCLNDMYPMAETWGISGYKYIPYALRPAMREYRWFDFTGRVFGKKRNSKRMQEAVSNTDPYIVAYAREFRGLVPDDELTAFVENTHFDDEMMEGFNGEDPRVRFALKAMNEKSRRTLLARGMDLSDITNLERLRHYGKDWQKGIVARDTDYARWSDLLMW